MYKIARKIGCLLRQARFKWLGVLGLGCFLAPWWMLTERGQSSTWWYYICLVVTGGCYAILLEWLQRIGWRSAEYTWAEVVVGVALALAPANLLAWQGTTMPLEMINYAFVATGLPVILWQIMVSVGRWRILKNDLAN